MSGHRPPSAPSGPTYLCQVGESVSCGACCGLYNVARIDRRHLTALLLERTLAFDQVDRTLEAILAFQAWVEAREDQERPFPEFHHCPYIGLVGPDRSRVGCLLHPLIPGNRGVDYRGLSHWGGAACRLYFCPASRCLPDRWKSLITALADDWFTYGQLVTEHRLLEACFREVETRLGRAIDPATDLVKPEARSALQGLLGLKFAWPLRHKGSEPGGHYFFEDRRYRRPVLDLDRLGLPPSSWAVIIEELETDVTSTDDLRRAEDRLEELLSRVSRTLGLP